MKGIMIILALIVPLCCTCITSYQEGDLLYVWAASGLNMRKAPALQSEVIATLPFGAAAISRDNKSVNEYQYHSQKLTDRGTTFDDKPFAVVLRGNWVKVTYDGVEGFVFDAYLSSWAPLSDPGAFTSVSDYFKQVCDTAIYLERRDTVTTLGTERIVFSNGAYVSSYFHTGGFGFQMNLPEYSVEEAYLLLLHLNKQVSGIIQDENGKIHVGWNAGGFTIESYRGIVIISGEWAC